MRGLSTSLDMPSQVPSVHFIFLSQELQLKYKDNAALAEKGQSQFFQLWLPLVSAYK